MMGRKGRKALRVVVVLCGLVPSACDRIGGTELGAAATGVASRPLVASADDWCGGHAIPESMCTKCNPELIGGFQAAGDWCAEHGYPESACPLCNPMAPPASRDRHDDHDEHRDHDEPHATDAAVDWCGEHALPGSMCTRCNPELSAGFQAAGDWCAEHGFPESACPLCNPVAPPPGVTVSAIVEGTKLRFRSPDLERAAGIETVPARADRLGVGIDVTARIDFDRNAMADVRSPVPGIVRSVAVDLGDHVEAGATLFTLESSEVGDLQARKAAARERARASRANLRRQEELQASDIAPAREVELARQELEAAEAELRSIEDALRISGASAGAGAGRFDVAAPLTGTVVRRPALLGHHASSEDSMATIADTSRMWALLDVPEWDATALAAGQPIELRVDGIGGRAFEGRITWIAAEVDPRTRTVTARAEVANPDGLLRAGQFARASVAVEAPYGATSVPVESVQRLGEESVVFVRLEAGVFEPRVVEPGRSDGRRVQVAGDLHDGDPVVTTGAFLLRTELDRDGIGAGCCEVDPAGGT